MFSTNEQNHTGRTNENHRVLLNAHLRKVHRQERYLLSEKEIRKRKNNCRRLVSLDELNDHSLLFAGNDANVSAEEVFDEQELHKALMFALKQLSEIEKQIIDECFFFEGHKKPSYDELGNRYSISKQSYYRKLNRILHKLKTLNLQNIS